MTQTDFQVDEECCQSDESLTRNGFSTSGAREIRHLAKAGESAFNQLQYGHLQTGYLQLSAFEAHGNRS